MRRSNPGLLFLLLFIGLLIIAIWGIKNYKNEKIVTSRDLITQSGVCPPFNLYDEAGNIIDPVNGINADNLR